MKKTLPLALWLLLAVSLHAESPATHAGQPAPSDAIASSGAVTSTPDMWLYSQEQSRHDNTQQAIRRKAEYQSAQRLYRIESSKWYGYSAMRPTANPTPVMGEFSTRWVNSPSDPMKWRTAVPGELSARWLRLY